VGRGVIYPGSTIGILGGGQLGRMIAIEGKRMGYNIVCLDPTPKSPCGQVADEQIVAALDDLTAAYQLGERSDLILYEFENISLEVVQELEQKFYLPQGSSILGIAQNRVREKSELQKGGFPVVPFAVVGSSLEIEKWLDEHGYPCILKTTQGGYDGKGQYVVTDNNELLSALNQIDLEQGWILEKKVELISELSVIVARNKKGEIAIYPVGENIHQNNILHKTIIPSNIPIGIQQEASRITGVMAGDFNLIGLLVVEFFLTPQGLYVNEIAPRPHNSGHYTMDACYVSQFEQLIRAVCGLPLGSTELLTPAIMYNILGKNIDTIMKNIDNFSGNVKVHLYGKKGKPEPNRKVGHLVIKNSQCSTDDIILLEKEGF